MTTWQIYGHLAVVALPIWAAVNLILNWDIGDPWQRVAGRFAGGLALLALTGTYWWWVGPR